jgi:hypothetical protein
VKRAAVAGLIALAAVISCGTPGGRPTDAAVPSDKVTGTAGLAVPVFKGALAVVSADSATDAWAIGQSLIVHWNGRKWSAVPDPVPGTSGGLNAVRAFSKDDVWIAGIGRPGTSAFILHWNGKTWSKVKTPALDGVLSLSGLAGTSPSNLWAVGESVPGYALPAILHWNGKAWSKVKAPLPRGVDNGYLNAVTVLSPADAWTVGGYATAITHPLVLHWNGRQWFAVASPNAGSGSLLTSVTVFSAKSAWAAGAGDDGSNALLLHWNGRSWSKVAVKDAASVDIRSVTAASATSAWAAGDVLGPLNAQQSLVMHWNGKAWTRVASGAPKDTTLWDIAVFSGASAWAVGADNHGKPSLGGGNDTAVILHWNGKAWS